MRYFRVYKNGKRSDVINIDDNELDYLVHCDNLVGYAQFLDGKCISQGKLSNTEIIEAKTKYSKD